VRTIEVRRVAWRPENPNRDKAGELLGPTDAVKLIDADTGGVVAVQHLLGDEALDDQRLLARWLRLGIKWDAGSGARLSGIAATNRAFGFLEPRPLRQQWVVSRSALSRDHAELDAILRRFANVCWSVFVDHAPKEAEQHLGLVSDSVHPDWLLAGVPWTSGIINHTNVLPYHRDSGNVKNAWSAMLTLREGVGGGGLHLPEYDATLGTPNGSIVIFNGQDVWHGVTPIESSGPRSYRFTLVWYTKAGIAGKGSAKEEIERARRRRTEIETESLVDS